MSQTFTCPWCGYEVPEHYAVQLHVEEHHTEDSPFAVQESSTSTPPRAPQRQNSSKEVSRSPQQWMRCTRAGCGEYVSLTEIDEHLDLHEVIAAAEKEERRSDQRSPGVSRSHNKSEASNKESKVRRSKPPASNGKKSSEPSPSTASTILSYFSGKTSTSKPLRNPLRERRENGRLGTKELGPHAFESSMPSSVRRMLETAARPVYENHISRSGKLVRGLTIPNETSGLIPVLADLCALDDTFTTYFCHASTKHVHRIQCDGNFCGYWNVQMMLSYIYATSQTHQREHVPTVMQIQETIETAWSNGICSYGRTETGGILNTRKWIGTHEAAAYFLEIGVPISASSFQHDEETDTPAHEVLLDRIEGYFMSGSSKADEPTVRGASIITDLPPVYFQRAGHSMTVVGLQRKNDGRRSMILFDPSFATSDAMMRLVEGRTARARPETLLDAYRKSEGRLSQWNEFEILVPEITP